MLGAAGRGDLSDQIQDEVFGGDAIGIQRMARALVARGHDVTVVHDEDSYLILSCLLRRVVVDFL